MNRNFQEQLQLVIEQALNKSQTPGATVAVYADGQTFLEAGFGYQNLKCRKALPTDAKFYIYSITKSLLATASLLVLTKGLIDLDNPVQTYLPNLTFTRKFTIRHLLSHTSGLPDYGGTADYLNSLRTNPNSPWSVEMFVNFAQKQCLQFAPGEKWAYSNIGYLLVKLVLEEVTGLSIQQCLHELIFKPLSLQNTFVADTLNSAYELTPGYSSFFSENELQDVTPFYHPGWVAHGVVVSTASELAKIIDTLFAGKLLNPLLVKQMSCPTYILGKHHLFELLGYGLGLFVDVKSPYGVVGGHVGEGPGYSVAAFHLPNLAGCRATLVAVANRDRHDLGLQLVFNLIDTIEKFADS